LLGPTVPVAIGDRAETVQDLPAALMGTRFPVAGDAVRLFMQWGFGLAAQHLDMDLSCHIAFAGRHELCSFSRLVATGCKHSGDIREIPDLVGTAEHIEIDPRELEQARADYLVFTCNAYSRGSITPSPAARLRIQLCLNRSTRRLRRIGSYGIGACKKTGDARRGPWRSSFATAAVSGRPTC